MLRAALRWFLVGASLVMAALFAIAFHQQYWQWRDCFNELGRCYDPVEGVVYLEQSGMVWAGLALISACFGVASWLFGRTRSTRH
jgi:hypothetical protein